MKEPKNEFGRELRFLRTRGHAKYTQAQLADLVGVTPSYISQLETGKRRPKPVVVRRLGIHLGVKPNHLFSTLGMVEMDLASTLMNNLDRVRREMPDLPESQLGEVASYLTYLDFKESVLTHIPTAGEGDTGGEV